MFKIDPYAGSKLSDAKVGDWDIADEPGYDKEVRSGFIEQMSEAISHINESLVHITSIDDDGTISFKSESGHDDSDTIDKEAFN